MKELATLHAIGPVPAQKLERQNQHTIWTKKDEGSMGVIRTRTPWIFTATWRTRWRPMKCQQPAVGILIRGLNGEAKPDWFMARVEGAGCVRAGRAVDPPWNLLLASANRAVQTPRFAFWRNT
jgi:hypothetical protein